MGTVYRARDTRLGRTVAIKLLHPALGDDADVARRFADEARTLASLNHPNIGAIFGLEDVAGQLALILEFVDGTTLAERIRSGPVAVGEALEIARQVADALDAAHTHGFLHRDLKPANIKIRNDGTVKVLDFGLACAFDVKARDGREPRSPAKTASIAGTAGYVSPERVRGAVADRRADVWAFGCVLFEMLAGQPVFAGGTIGEIFAEVLKSEPEWQRLPARTPPPFDACFGAACARRSAPASVTSPMYGWTSRMRSGNWRRRDGPSPGSAPGRRATHGWWAP